MRVCAGIAYYTNGRSWQFECPTDAEFIAFWNTLPDDGALAFKFFFDKKAPTRLAQHLNGNDWYWLQPTDSGILFGHSNDSQGEISTRYPGALLKRGQWTTTEEMERVVELQTAAMYWGDEPLDTSLGGCCGN